MIPTIAFPIANTWISATKRTVTPASLLAQLWRRSASAPNPEPRRGSRAARWFRATIFKCSAWSRGWGADVGRTKIRCRAGIPEARIRERRVRPRQDYPAERHEIHGDWCGSGQLPGDVNVRPSRLLHAAGYGARLFHQHREEFF